MSSRIASFTPVLVGALAVALFASSLPQLGAAEFKAAVQDYSQAKARLKKVPFQERGDYIRTYYNAYSALYDFGGDPIARNPSAIEPDATDPHRRQPMGVAARRRLR